MRGYALLLGINNIQSEYYGNSYNLPESVDNIDAMESFLCNDVGFNQGDIKKLTSTDNSWQNVQTKIGELTQIPQSESPFIIIYLSCHGTKIKYSNTSFTEKNFLCFYDRMVLENEFRQLIASFPSYFKVNVIIDSCYSEGLDAEYMEDQEIESGNFTAVYNRHQNSLYAIVQNYQAQPAVPYQADTCFFYSVEQNVPAYFSDKQHAPTLFTRYLINLWNNYIKPNEGIKFNYPDFINDLMKNFTRSPFNPVVRIYPSPVSANNFFVSTITYQFIGTPLSINSREYLVVDITEPINNTLTININGLHPNYEYKNHVVWHKKIDGYSDEWQLLSNKIRAIKPYLLDDIEYIVTVFVDLNVTTTPIFTKEITQLRTVNSTIISEGGKAIVVICDVQNNNKIVGHKRTKGKVSNKLG